MSRTYTAEETAAANLQAEIGRWKAWAEAVLLTLEQERIVITGPLGGPLDWLSLEYEDKAVRDALALIRQIRARLKAPNCETCKGRGSVECLYGGIQRVVCQSCEGRGTP